MVNRKFAKLTDGVLVYAPAVIRVDGRTIIGGKAEHYASLGYLPLNLSITPSAPEGYHLESRGYEVVDGEIRRSWEQVKDAPVYRVFSKLKCYTLLAKMGQWTSVKTWLETQGLWDAFVLAQDVSEDNPMFQQGLTAMKSLLGLTDEEVEAFLAQCQVD